MPIGSRDDAFPARWRLLLPAALLIFLFLPVRGWGQSEMQEAGVCSRCHVVSVLEWKASAHREAGVRCNTCHGVSEGHVANERNEVKPDWIRRADAADPLCAQCHNQGCPTTGRTSSCLECHHNHALSQPGQIQSFQGDRQQHPLVEQRKRFEAFQKQLQEGERFAAEENWLAARDAFAAALDLRPGDSRALARLNFVRNRLDPSLPGFEIIGEAFGPETGLPRNVRVEDLGMEMVLISPGDFDMGSERFANAQPVHTVRVGAFYLAKNELTQAQWKQVMESNPSTHQDLPESSRMPVESVSWDDAQDLLARLNDRVAGGSFRLPAEAEWEYAAKAVEGVIDESELSRHAWFRENSALAAAEDADLPKVEQYAPRPVGRKEPNAWDLYDMLGNVWEWCSSLASPYPYRADDGREQIPANGLRVLRGGGYADSAALVHPALRHGEHPDRRYRWNGIRLARDVPPRQPGGDQ